MPDDVRDVFPDEAPFRLLFEHSPDGILLVDPHHASGAWTIVACNDVAGELHGYRPDEIIGQPLDLLNVYPAPVTTADYSHYLELLRRESSFLGEAIHRRKDGSSFPVEYSTTLLIFQGRELILGVDRDISERKRLQAIETRETQFRLLFEHSPDALLLVDPGHDGGAWAILACNPGAGRLYGFPPDALVGMPIQMLGWAEADPIAASRCLRELGLGNPLMDEAVHRQNGGAKVDVERSLTLVTQEGRDLILATIRDISVRKWRKEKQDFLAAASALLATSLEYEQTLETLGRLAVPRLADWCSINVVDEYGEWVRAAGFHVDPEKAAALNALRQKYPPRQPSVIAPDPILIPIVTEKHLQELAHYPEQLPVYTAMGFRSVMIVPLALGTRFVGMMIFMTAESGRRYGQEDLALAQDLSHRAALAVDNARLYSEAQAAIAVRDEFLSIAAHELKTPVTSLLGYAQILQQRGRLGGTVGERELRALKIMAEQSARLSTLVETLLDVSRIRRGAFAIERQMFDLGALAQRIADELQPTLDEHLLTCTIPMEPILVDGDPSRIEQVVQNLLHNAIKYSPEGGPIVLHVEQQAQQAILQISDQGIGIPKEAQDQLFQRFYRAPHHGAWTISGMGIGLYVVSEIVSRHGGTVSVESVEGEGSTFTVRLPLQPE